MKMMTTMTMMTCSPICWTSSGSSICPFLSSSIEETSASTSRSVGNIPDDGDNDEDGHEDDDDDDVGHEDDDDDDNDDDGHKDDCDDG